MDEIDKIIKEPIRKTVDETLSDCREPIMEMAKINLKDGGTSLFPSNAYNIIVQGDNSPHKLPHIHVISKQEGFDIKILIKSGELWQVENYGGRKRFSDIVYKIKEWLSLPSNIPMAKGDTNQVFAMGLWELNNP